MLKRNDRGYSTALVAVLATIVGVAVLIGIFFAAGIFSNKTANFRGNVAKNNLTKANGNYRIASYEKFFDECAAAQTDQQNIPLDKQALAADTKGTQTYEIDKQTLVAIESSLNQEVVQYNTDSAKAGTVAQFKASTLPYTLSASEKIQCTVS